MSDRWGRCIQLRNETQCELLEVDGVDSGVSEGGESDVDLAMCQ